MRKFILVFVAVVSLFGFAEFAQAGRRMAFYSSCSSCSGGSCSNNTVSPVIYQPVSYPVSNPVANQPVYQPTVNLPVAVPHIYSQAASTPIQVVPVFGGCSNGRCNVR